MPDSNPDDAESVELPQSVVDRIRERLPETEFDSVDEYATVALDGLLRELDATPATESPTPTEGPATDADGVGEPDADCKTDDAVDATDDAESGDVDDAVAERLAALGYR